MKMVSEQDAEELGTGADAYTIERGKPGWHHSWPVEDANHNVEMTAEGDMRDGS